MKHLSFAVAACALLACNSPILNHSNASDAFRSPVLDAKCPLALPTAGLCASWTWDRMPNGDETGTAVLRFWRVDGGTEAGPYVSPSDTVFVKLWMPDMGHGSAPTATAPMLDAAGNAIPGVFSVTKIYFVMPGDWEILLQLKQADRLIEQAILPVTI